MVCVTAETYFCSHVEQITIYVDHVKELCALCSIQRWPIMFVQVIDPLPISHQLNGDYFSCGTTAVRENSYQSSRSSEDGQSVFLKPEVN